MNTLDLSRRRFLLAGGGAAAAVAGGGLLSACAGSVGSSGNGKGGVTLTVMSTELKPEDAAAFQAAFPKIRLNVVPEDETRLNAMLAAGGPPDVIRGAGALQTPYLAARKLAENLDAYVAKSKALPAADLDPVNDLWRFDGAKQGSGPRYGIAKDFSQDQMFWFNTKVFDEAAVTPPSTTEPLTYEHWMELAKELTKRSGGRTRVFGADVIPSKYLAHFLGMTAAAGGRVFSDDLTKVDFSSPEARKVLQFYVDFADAGAGPNLMNPAPAGGGGALFMAGRLAMYNQGYWYGGTLATEPVGEFARLAPAPTFGGTRVSPCYAATGYWMAAKSKHKDEAWQFMEWLLGGAQAKSRAGIGWGVPTLKSLRGDLPTAEPFQAEALRTQNAELPYFTTLTVSPYVKADAVDAVVSQQLPALIKRGAGAGAIADALNFQINELLKQGRQLVR